MMAAMRGAWPEAHGIGCPSLSSRRQYRPPAPFGPSRPSSAGLRPGIHTELVERRSLPLA